jgi:hypothetical protein
LDFSGGEISKNDNEEKRREEGSETHGDGMKIAG